MQDVHTDLLPAGKLFDNAPRGDYNILRLCLIYPISNSFFLIYGV